MDMIKVSAGKLRAIGYEPSRPAVPVIEEDIEGCIQTAERLLYRDIGK